jgi:hypothetical protein
VKSRRPARTPDPSEAVPARVPDEDATEAELDAFLAALARRYTGRITQIHAQRGLGQVETATGHTLPFSLGLVRVAGGIDAARRLRRGMRVGFDVALTDDGPQIVALWPEEAPRRSE